MRTTVSLIEQAVIHQLEHSADKIENGDGVVVDFDYDEEVDEYYEEMGKMIPPEDSKKERTVTLELTYILPE